MSERAIACASCGVQPKHPVVKRLPQGWKRRGEQYFCRDCWRKAYILWAITFAVAEPVAGRGGTRNGDLAVRLEGRE